MKKSKLQALLSLLDDPDQTVYNIVEKELLKENDRIIPSLEKVWENSFDEISQERIENLIQHLHFKQTKKLLKKWLSVSGNDLLEGFLLVDRFQYPDLNHSVIMHKLEQIKKSVWLEMKSSLTLLEKTAILNHFLFNIHGFSINHNHINSPQNCFLNQMLDTKKGNAISMSVLYIYLARELDLPARFIDFPRNPLVAIVDRGLARKVHGVESLSDVLFYINPSNKGSITSRKEIEYHLVKNNIEPISAHSEPAPERILIFRLFESLKIAYQSVGYKEKEMRTEELLSLF